MNKIIIMSLIVMLAMTSCVVSVRKNDYTIVEKTVNVGDFTKIKICKDANVEYVYGPKCSLKVIATEREHVRIHVGKNREGVLCIEYAPTISEDGYAEACCTAKPTEIKVIVTSPCIEKVTVEQGRFSTNDTIRCDREVEIVNTSYNDIKIKAIQAKLVSLYARHNGISVHSVMADSTSYSTTDQGGIDVEEYGTKTCSIGMNGDNHSTIRVKYHNCGYVNIHGDGRDGNNVMLSGTIQDYTKENNTYFNFITDGLTVNK